MLVWLCICNLFRAWGVGGGGEWLGTHCTSTCTSAKHLLVCYILASRSLYIVATHWLCVNQFTRVLRVFDHILMSQVKYVYQLPVWETIWVWIRPSTRWTLSETIVAWNLMCGMILKTPTLVKVQYMPHICKNYSYILVWNIYHHTASWPSQNVSIYWWWKLRLQVKCAESPDLIICSCMLIQMWRYTHISSNVRIFSH